MTFNEKRHIQLSWKIIEAKILYYSPGEISESFINENLPSDADYDAMELEYLYLCRLLGLENTVVHKEHPGFKAPGKGMLEVDWTRPSVLLAYDKLKKLDGITTSMGE